MPACLLPVPIAVMVAAIATAPAPPDPIGRYPKRKRAAVSYGEADLTDDDVFIAEEGEEIDDESGARPNKKRKAAKKEPRQKPFPFLSLPPELRIKIYQEALTGSGRICIGNARRGLRRSCAGYAGDGPWTRPATNLLATSQAVYAEAAAVLYEQRFQFDDNRALLAFLSLLRPATTARLRDVAVATWNGGRTSSGSMIVPAMALLSPAGAGGLRRLRVETELLLDRDWGSWGFGTRGYALAALLARKVFRDCYPLLYAVRARRGPAAALAVVDLADVNFAGVVGTTPGGRKWADPPGVQDPSHAEKMAFRRRSYEKELGRLLGGEAADVEAVRESPEARACA